MEQFEVDMIRATSIPLPDGGDTHIHPWGDGSGFTVTTRLPGVPYAEHDSFTTDQFDG